MKVIKFVLFLHENAPTHRAFAAQRILAYLRFHCLDHPPYSADFPLRTITCSLDWKKNLNVRHISSDKEVIATAETWLDGQLSEFFLISGLQKLEQQVKKCIELRKEYDE